METFWSKSWKAVDPRRIDEYITHMSMEPDEIISFLKDHHVHTVCDAGCGCGIYTAKLLHHGFTAAGFDISEAAVEIAKAHAAPADLKAADILSREGIACSVARAAKVIPYDENLLKEITGPIITVEEGTLSGGFGSAVCADLAMRNKRLPILRIGLHDACTTQGCRDKQLAAYSLDAQGIARQIREWRTSL